MIDLNEESLMDVVINIRERADDISLNTTRIVMSSRGTAVMRLLRRSWDENWDWRRRKRELRRPETSTYSRKQ